VDWALAYEGMDARIESYMMEKQLKENRKP